MGDKAIEEGVKGVFKTDKKLAKGVCADERWLASWERMLTLPFLAHRLRISYHCLDQQHHLQLRSPAVRLCFGTEAKGRRRGQDPAGRPH